MSKPTDRLYYTNSYLASFCARIVERGAESTRVVLESTAFYPTSGGQPHDLGTIDGIRVLDVVDEGNRIIHVLEAPLQRNEANCKIDWARRFDHMQQHTGQHLLSSVLADLYAFETVSFHMGADSCTIDLATPTLSRDQIEAAEVRANSVIHENRPVRADFEDASKVTGLRKKTERTGTIRVVTIDQFDRSACGGTHVRNTGEIGAILLRSTDKVRGNIRLEFVCGSRAVKFARADYNTVHRELPAMLALNTERLKEAEKLRRKLEDELAGRRGRDLYLETVPDSRGLRVVERLLPVGPLGEDVRSEANAFTAGGKAVYIAVAESPAAVLLASSTDAGVHCGNVLKPVLAEFSGRGGGAATLAQGTFAGNPRELLRRLVAAV